MMNLGRLQGKALYYAVLETFIQMRAKLPELRKFTHIRAQRSRYSIHWSLLRADANTVHEQRSINFGDDANTAMWRIFEPFVTGQKFDVARVTIAFEPQPSMSIDILDEQNTPIISMNLITIEVANGR